MAPVLETLNDLGGHLPVADLFKRTPSTICTAFYQISTNSVLARSLRDSWASCYIRCSMCPPCCWTTHLSRRRQCLMTRSMTAWERQVHRAWHVAPNSRNLNPVDYAVSGALQQIVLVYQRRRFTTINQLKQAIHTEWGKLSQRFNIVAFQTLYISQLGSVVTHLRCGRIFSDSIITNFLPILTVKQFWKSANTW